MENKNILITGCSSGIGKATAKLLKEKSWRVFPAARNFKDVEILLREGFEACQLDLESSASIKSAVDFVLSKTESNLFALINNAGFEIISAVEDLTREELRTQFEVNLFGLQELTNLLLPTFRKQGFGRIINLSSLAGNFSLPYTGAYCASKFGLEALSETLRAELFGTQIYLSLLELGPIIATAFNKNAVNFLKTRKTENSLHAKIYKNIERNLQKCIQKNTTAKRTSPEDVAKIILRALESKKPRFRYFPTKKTYIFWVMVKMLPQFLVDLITRKYLKPIKN